MFRNQNDMGKTRQFYQILSAFVPGQTYNYSPNLNTDRNPSLTVITRRISNVVVVDQETEASIRYWSKDKIATKINEYSGERPDDLRFIRLNYDPNEDIVVQLEIYPRTFIYRKKDSSSISWNLDTSDKKKDRRTTQAQFVFCNSRQGIFPFSVQGRSEVPIAFPNEENWKNQRIVLNESNNPLYPLSASYSYDTNFDRIRDEFRKYPSDWKFKPILSSSRVVFTPIHFFDIFYPKIASFKEIMHYLLSLDGVREDDLKEDMFLDMLLKNIDESYPLETIMASLGKHTFSANTKNIPDKIKTAYTKAKDPKIKESYKLMTLEDIPPKRKKEAMENTHLKSYGISSISYLEPLKCIEMCIGWITGKVDPGINSNQAPLQRIHADVDRRDIVFDHKNANWNILYNIMESEGLLFRFRKQTSFIARHTFSHLLLKVLPEFSGIEESTLSEEVFENENAIMIYSREPGDFKTYGLKHVFDNSLAYLLESAKEFSDCPFENDDTGCYYCLHRPVGCDLFNGSLSKRKLSEI
jgi:hypothetical protein